jgi:hypothetical protein
MSPWIRRKRDGFGVLQKQPGRFSWRGDEVALIGRKLQPVTNCNRLIFAEAGGFQLVTICHQLAIRKDRSWRLGG